MTIAWRRQLSRFIYPLIAFLLAVAAAMLCRHAAGVSLGLFFGGVAFTTLVVPPLTAGESTPVRRAIVAILVCLGVSLVWLSALSDVLSMRQWLACFVALLAYSLALGGICACLVSLGANAVVTSAFITVLGLLWLTWPVWLSRVLTTATGEFLVDWLVPAHPLFAINAVLQQFDSWDRYPLAYSRLTVLNQDVFYSMPAGVLWTTSVHALIGVTALAWAVKIERQKQLDFVPEA
jgi:hypothetical protein